MVLVSGDIFHNAQKPVQGVVLIMQQKSGVFLMTTEEMHSGLGRLCPIIEILGNYLHIPTFFVTIITDLTVFWLATRNGLIHVKHF